MGWKFSKTHCSAIKIFSSLIIHTFLIIFSYNKYKIYSMKSWWASQWLFTIFLNLTEEKNLEKKIAYLMISFVLLRFWFHIATYMYTQYQFFNWLGYTSSEFLKVSSNRFLSGPKHALTLPLSIGFLSKKRWPEV